MVDGMQEGWTTTQTHVQDGSTEMLGSMQDGWIAFGVEHTTASGAMRDSWTETVTGMQDQAGIGFNAIGAAWAQVTMDMQWDALRAAQGINTALSTIRDRTVTITTIHRTVTSKVAGKRAEGGPVTGGLSYLVGERGEPEVFTPSESGYVSPIGRGGGGMQPIVIRNTVHLSRREVTTAVAEDVFPRGAEARGGADTGEREKKPNENEEDDARGAVDGVPGDGRAGGLRPGGLHEHRCGPDVRRVL